MVLRIIINYLKTTRTTIILRSTHHAHDTAQNIFVFVIFCKIIYIIIIILLLFIIIVACLLCAWALMIYFKHMLVVEQLCLLFAEMLVGLTKKYFYNIKNIGQLKIFFILRFLLPSFFLVLHHQSMILNHSFLYENNYTLKQHDMII